MHTARFPNSLFLRLTRLSDVALANVLSLGLFVLAAWPQLLLRLPPYQDLPDHLATIVILQNPSRYPEFVSTGVLHSNAIFATFLYYTSPFIGLVTAARVFVIATLATTSIVLPRFVLAFGDRQKMLLAAPFLAPMVHNWWVAMGMFNFALAFPLGLLVLMLSKRQLAEPNTKRNVQLALLSVLLWYTHSIPLLLCAGLLGVEAIRTGIRNGDSPAAMAKGSLRIGLRLLLPLVPGLSLVAYTIFAHAHGASEHSQSADASWNQFRDIASMLYEFWAFWMMQISPLTGVTIVLALVLGYYAIRRARLDVPFLSSPAVLLLLALYVFLPECLPGFGYVGQRIIPILWAAILVRIPERMPRLVTTVCALCSIAWSLGSAVELVRAERDLAQFTSAAPFIPENARLLTLNFEPRLSAKNTFSLLHASGMYVVLKHVNAQDVWADSPTMPIYRPGDMSPLDDPSYMQRLTASANSMKGFCKVQKRLGLAGQPCADAWASTWSEVWRLASDEKDYVLLWGATDEVRAGAPRSWEVVHTDGPLVLLKVKRKAAENP
ncbi:MAG: hypothetical protein U0174_24285 [Polyangiaceae bacterium]